MLLLDMGAISEDIDIEDIDDDMDEDMAPLIFLCFIFGIFDMLLLDMLSDDIEVPCPGRSWA